MNIIPPPYNNQEEKKRFFSLEIINTDEQLNGFMSSLPQLHKNKMGVWRGLPESSFKLYNSLQRKNLESKKLNSLNDVIQAIESSTNLINEWNKGLIVKYFSNYGVRKVSIFAKLSILQHFGCETPLLDWTRNPNVALYFATSSNVKYQVKNPIDDYFSIYFIKREHSYFSLNSKTEYEFFTSKNPKTILSRILRFKKIRFTKSFVNEYFNHDNYILSNIKEFPIQRIDDDDIKSINYYTKSNYYITAQDGLFILNADPYLPLEESIIQRIKDIAQQKHRIEIDKNEALIRNRQNFICYDIHKRFIPKIIDALYSETINRTKESLFPDFNKIKEKITFEKITDGIGVTK